MSPLERTRSELAAAADRLEKERDAALAREAMLFDLVRRFRALNQVKLEPGGSTVPWMRAFTQLERDCDSAIAAVTAAGVKIR